MLMYLSVNPPVVEPLQVLQPGEAFEGDSEIPQEYFDVDARLDELNRRKREVLYNIHCRECSQIQANRRC